MKGISNNRGTSLVEFAIVCMVLLLFIFGIIDFGYFFYHQHVLKDATREGARIAVLGGITETEIKKAVKDKLVLLKTPEENIDISISPNPPSANQPVTVTVTIPFSLIVLPSLTGVNISSVSSSITMVHEP
jgi:Flp pilus assembly protein TadG